MSQFTDTAIAALTARGLYCIRSGAGKASQFFSTNYGDLFAIRVLEGKPGHSETTDQPEQPPSPEAVELIWTVTFDTFTSEKPIPIPLRDESGNFLRVTTKDAFDAVVDEWTQRVAAQK